MSNQNVFDLFTINPQRPRFSHNTAPKRPSEKEIQGTQVRKGIDEIKEQIALKRINDSFSEIGG